MAERGSRLYRTVLFLLGFLAAMYCHAQPGPNRNTSQTMPCASVSSPERAYSFKLTSFAATPDLASGVLLQARINGGPALRLLLDSGAEQITLGSRASARSAVAAVSDANLVGAGELPARSARSGMAGAVDVGPLRFGNCRVDVVSGGLAEGIDGVMPLYLFGSFLIRLDLPGKTLTLTPYPDAGSALSADSASVIGKGDLLLVRGTLNDVLNGYILLDTGASYSAVSQRTAKVLKCPLASTVGLTGANGALHGDLIAGGVRFGVAGLSLAGGPVVAVDLGAFNQFHGVETIGVLGYPALRADILTVSYRDALVRIAAPSKRGSPGVLMADGKRADTRRAGAR